MTDRKVIYGKYSTLLDQACFLSPQDTGAVRLALRMALDEVAEGAEVAIHQYENSQLKRIKESLDERLLFGIESLKIADAVEMELKRLDETCLEYGRQLAGKDAEIARLKDELRKAKGAAIPNVGAPVVDETGTIVAGNGRIACIDGVWRLNLNGAEPKLKEAEVKIDAAKGRRQLFYVERGELDALRKETIKCLQTQAREMGHVPSRKEFAARWKYLPTPQTIAKRLDCRWNSIVIDAGLLPHDSPADKFFAGMDDQEFDR